MADLLSINELPLQGNAQSINGGPLVCVQQKDKMADRSGCYQTSDFWGKGWVISDKNFAGGTKQYCLNTKQQITLKFND